MKTETKTCLDCSKMFEADVIEWNGRNFCLQTYCDPCLEKLIEKERVESTQKADNASQKSFWAMFPPIYKDTDKSRLDARLRAEIDAYSYGTKGLGFSGESGAGKTRSMVELMKSLYNQGKSVIFMKATRLTEVAHMRFDDDRMVKAMAKVTIDQCKSRDCLLLDDLGKGRLPASAEELLFDIIDTRMEMGLPLFWTSNAKAKDLHAAFSPDRADPLIRRLAEFGKILSV